MISVVIDVLGCSEFDDDDDSALRSVCRPICHCLNVSTVILFFELLGSFALCLRGLRLVYNLLLCVVVDSVVVVNSVFIVSVCNRLSSVVVGCRLFRLCHALSAFFKLSRFFDLFNIILTSSSLSQVLFQIVSVDEVLLKLFMFFRFVLNSRRLSGLFYVVFGVGLVRFSWFQVV